MAFEINYSFLDKVLHKLAFLSPKVQLMAADLEELLFSREYESIAPLPPIFISSVPRAGTTLVLEILHRFPSVATNTYRDMPFVMAPVLWSRISGSFQKSSELRERAHGDGMKIGFDSPEAFEEILWKAFWPDKYGRDRIKLWEEGDQQPEADKFFIEHFKKIISLRCPDKKGGCRYVSKNNTNIARLQFLGSMFPGARIVVPIRNPIEHAASLLRQHTSFIEMQKQEPFVSRYMDDIGHYEFGSLLRPVDFPEFSEESSTHSPLSLDYWLNYLIAFFDYLLKHKDLVLLLSYENLCNNGAEAVDTLCSKLDIQTDFTVDKASAILRPLPPNRANPDDGSTELISKANELYEKLVEDSIV